MLSLAISFFLIELPVPFFSWLIFTTLPKIIKTPNYDMETTHHIKIIAQLNISFYPYLIKF